MPELPEVETVRRDLSRLYVGQRLERVVVTGRRTVRRHPVELLAGLDGRTLAEVGRHGKYLLLSWDNGPVLVVHLRMSGQLLACPHERPPVAHTHAVLRFGGAGELRFVDPRTFGELFLAGPGVGPGEGPVDHLDHLDHLDHFGQLGQLGHLGPDALAVDAIYLRAALARRRRPLKSVLVDQTTLAGIGNIYADEICFAAGLRPDRPAGSLRAKQLERLAASVRSVLDAAIAARGSTLADQQYRDVQGMIGRYQLQHKVYGRAGLPCLSCGTVVERARMGAKSAYLCRKCQR